MEKIKMEYTFNTSRRILYNRLSTAGGLSQWFADEVDVNGQEYIFYWEGYPQKATVVKKRQNEFIRFRWDDGEQEGNEFEFRLEEDELTQDLALIVEDHVLADEAEDTRGLWDSQVNTLKHNLGL